MALATTSSCVTGSSTEEQKVPQKIQNLVSYTHFQGNFKGPIANEDVWFYKNPNTGGWTLTLTTKNKRREFFDDDADGNLDRIVIVEGNKIRFYSAKQEGLPDFLRRAQSQYERTLLKIRAFAPEQRRLSEQRKAQYLNEALDSLEPSTEKIQQ